MQAQTGTSPLFDRQARPLDALRVSVTDRCNLRCGYCMPSEVFDASHPFLPRSEILSYEEITRLVSVLAARGVTQVRLTGGEPLLRKDLFALVAQLVGLSGIEDVALTTNGLLLPRLAEPLRRAGLHRLTLSLDSLNDATFQKLTGRQSLPADVLRGLEAAEAAGFSSVKVNMVVQRGVNDTEILSMAEHFRGTGHVLRFIEFMDVGTTNEWRRDRVVPASEILEILGAQYPLEPTERRSPSDVAMRYRYRDGGGEIGVIASVTQPFCGACSRARLSAKGELFTCLFASQGIDLRADLRTGASDEALSRRLDAIWTRREDRYSELRGQTDSTPQSKVEMSYIGG